MKTTVFLTGATGTMGWAGLQELLRYPERYHVKVLARPSKKNRKKLAPLEGRIEIVWGDLLNRDDIRCGVEGSDIVLHVGGMVSPEADKYPELTWKVNVGAARLIRDVVTEQENQPKVVYIGSVAQMGNRSEPYHWGRCGDPLNVSAGDCYARSKVAAERIIADGGIRRWASLRQSGILYAGILKNYDPIMFHVPLRGVLEWATVEDSGRLLERVCRPEVDDNFWGRFYNISSGEQYRLMNYEFECLLLEAIGCPPPEKIFEARWFATRNFHGMWYLDSDELERQLHFRDNIPVKEYFRRLAEGVPKITHVAKYIPWIVKQAMRPMAFKKDVGTQSWLRSGDTSKADLFYGGVAEYNRIPDWDGFDLSRPGVEAIVLSHGYDETKPMSEFDIDDMRKAAEFRGGRCLSESMVKGDWETPLEWSDAQGNVFCGSPRLILLGGHWTPLES